MKVSFDFDMTLTMPIIQDYAKYLIEKGVDGWVHTLRFPDDAPEWQNWNTDLWKVIANVGINPDKVVFCEMTDKWNFLGEDFIWHLDDDYIECNLINKNTATIGICHDGNSTWKNKCEKLLNV